MFYNLGEALADARKSCGFTVAYMAEATGYSERSIYRYESNLLTPSLEYIVKISKKCSI